MSLPVMEPCSARKRITNPLSVYSTGCHLPAGIDYWCSRLILVYLKMGPGNWVNQIYRFELIK